MEKVLAVYLRRIIDQLEQAIAEVDDKLPKDIKRMPENIITDEKEAMCMLPIINLLGELQDDLSVLVPGIEPAQRPYSREQAILDTINGSYKENGFGGYVIIRDGKIIYRDSGSSNVKSFLDQLNRRLES